MPIMNPIKKNKFSILFNQDGYLKLSDYIKNNNFNKILILTDDNTKDNCLDIFISSITYKNDEVSKLIKSRLFYYSVKPGENSKNIDTSIEIWKFLTHNRFKRSDLIINLGGGMITDLGGFVASTFMRGIKFVNVPTTLLGMVDASIGGKTGIDFREIKNIIGVFEFAKIILVDYRFLYTLNKRQKTAGYAEMIKHSLISKKSEFDLITKINDVENIPYELIYQSIIAKVNIIDVDPFESKIRKNLNYGHTLGHAIESYFLSIGRDLLHGEAVAIGIILESYLSYLKTGFDYEIANKIKSYINTLFEIKKFSDTDISEIISLLKHDKKNSSDKPMFVLLENLGKPLVNQAVTEKEIEDAFKFYRV
tara:strand:- start:5537 stop:6631 length:1095 start_codon:yes stop_codon:yes gene_type:complete